MAWLTSNHQAAEAKEYLETNAVEITNHFRVYVTDFESFKVFITNKEAYLVIILRESCAITSVRDLKEDVELALTSWDHFPGEDANITLKEIVSYLIVKKDSASWWGYEWISFPEPSVRTGYEFLLA
ncbi:uncharacterized protein F4807DRAFT_462375 [Annulohypoxylon truncatum]|uniref:uncharacterized protein n=1 Tax=Annulohypoxylon truncatum TaxID=327061 RepID=UPI00200732B0|nr:uncharacterized protein F4807DRAFT_462375 [Annulohypoxylon truncatum]KAI1207565.1 hypothetical protein F4807DRAFT_462375 [Annulohypoxylon truncatum]